MDVFAAVVTVAFMGGAFGWVLYRNQRDYNRAKNASPLAPYVIRVSHGWNDAPPHMREMLLESCGVTDAEHREILIPRVWSRLPGDVQTALAKLQMLTEFEMANPALVAEMARNEERRGREERRNSYPTEEQIKTLWDAYEEGPDAFKDALAKNSKKPR